MIIEKILKLNKIKKIIEKKIKIKLKKIIEKILKLNKIKKNIEKKIKIK